MGRGAFWFEDEEFLQQKREWWVCYNGGGGGDGGGGGRSAALGRGGIGYGEGQVDAGLAAAAGIGPGFGHSVGSASISGPGAGTQAVGQWDARTVPVSPAAKFMGLSDEARQVNLDRDVMAHEYRGGGDRPRKEPQKQKEPKPEEPAPAPAPAAAEPRPAPRPAPKPAPAPAPKPAFDAAAYMAEIQAKYDEQMKAISEQLAAGEEARQKQLDELIKKTEDKKKKLKAPRKIGRLSLLSGSELGIPMTTTLGG